MKKQDFMIDYCESVYFLKNFNQHIEKIEENEEGGIIEISGLLAVNEITVYHYDNSSKWAKKAEYPDGTKTVWQFDKEDKITSMTEFNSAGKVSLLVYVFSPPEDDRISEIITISAEESYYDEYECDYLNRECPPSIEIERFEYNGDSFKESHYTREINGEIVYERFCEFDDRGRLIHRWDTNEKEEVFKYKDFENGDLVIESYTSEINEDGEKEEWNCISGFYADGVEMEIENIETDEEDKIISYSIAERKSERK